MGRDISISNASTGTRTRAQARSPDNRRVSTTSASRHLSRRRARLPGSGATVNPQLDLRPPLGHRRVGQPPLIPAVHPRRPGPAARTRPPPGPWARPDPHRSTDLVDPLDHHIRQVRQQNPNPSLINTVEDDHSSVIKSRPRHTQPRPSRSRKVGQIQFSRTVDNALVHLAKVPRLEHAGRGSSSFLTGSGPRGGPRGVWSSRSAPLRAAPTTRGSKITTLSRPGRSRPARARAGPAARPIGAALRRVKTATGAGRSRNSTSIANRVGLDGGLSGEQAGRCAEAGRPSRADERHAFIWTSIATEYASRRCSNVDGQNRSRIERSPKLRSGHGQHDPRRTGARCAGPAAAVLQRERRVGRRGVLSALG
ncbi:MAG: hypothetical protein JWR58_70 [Pseudonocardia sp.]|nr:hypothetical protein [Pseudonocardia sp.]